MCCSAGQIDWVKTLLESRPSLLTDSLVGVIQIGMFTEPRSPFAEALKAGHLGLAKYLLDAGASPNKMWYEVRSPLSLMTHGKTASKAGVALLLQHGAIADSPMCDACRIRHRSPPTSTAPSIIPAAVPAETVSKSRMDLIELSDQKEPTEKLDLSATTLEPPIFISKRVAGDLSAISSEAMVDRYVHGTEKKTPV